MSRLAALLPHAAAPASVAELEEAERRFGTRLPPDLRDFLLVSDGSTWTAFSACSFSDPSTWADVRVVVAPPGTSCGTATTHRHRLGWLAGTVLLRPTDGPNRPLDIVADEPPAPCASTVTELVEIANRRMEPIQHLRGLIARRGAVMQHSRTLALAGVFTYDARRRFQPSPVCHDAYTYAPRLSAGGCSRCDQACDCKTVAAGVVAVRIGFSMVRQASETPSGIVTSISSTVWNPYAR